MTTNRTHTTRNNNTGKIAAIVIMAVAVIAILVANILFVGDHEEEKFANKTSHVEWEYVNLRQGHNVGTDMIDQLHQGDEVTLTSRVFEAWDTEWIYVRSEKGNGWLVTASLHKPAE